MKNIRLLISSMLSSLAVALLVIFVVNTSGRVSLEEAAEQLIISQRGGQIHDVRVNGEEASVLFSFVASYALDGDEEEREEVPAIGWGRIERTGGGWRSDGSAAFYAVTEIERGQLAEYTTEPNLITGKLLAWGAIRSPIVTAVEGRFDTNEILSDSVVNGMFFLAASDAKALCELTLLDAENNVLQRLDPATTQHAHSTRESKTDNLCS